MNDLKCSSQLNGAVTNFAPMIGSIFSVIFFYNLTIPASGQCPEGFFFCAFSFMVILLKAEFHVSCDNLQIAHCSAWNSV